MNNLYRDAVAGAFSSVGVDVGERGEYREEEGCLPGMTVFICCRGIMVGCLSISVINHG